MTVAHPSQEPAARGRLGGCFGIASIVLLGAAIKWAHHWNPCADTIVALWALTTLGALGFSTWSVWTSTAARRFARLGIWLAVVSLLALGVAGLAYAAGMNPAGPCGGG